MKNKEQKEKAGRVIGHVLFLDVLVPFITL